MRKQIVILLVLAGCKADLPREDYASEPALYAVFEVGKTPVADVVGGNADFVDSEDILEWRWPDDTRESFIAMNGRMTLQSERLPQPGESSTLIWEGKHGHAEVELIMPPVPQLETLSADTLRITENLPIEIRWSFAGDEYEFVCALECLEESCIPIPGQTGNFNEAHNGPQVGNTLTLTADNFRYYGTHRLVIYTLNRAYTDVFFYDPSDIRGLLTIPESNIPGAKGFVMSTAALEVLLEVE